MKPVKTSTVLLGAAVLGTVAGVSISFWNQARTERELREMDEDMSRRVKNLPAEQFPEAAAEPPVSFDPRAVEGIPPYPNAVPSTLTRRAVSPGREEMISAWFSTEDTVDAVIGFYEVAFAKEQRAVVQHRFSPGAGYIGFIDPPTQRLHMIAVMRSGTQTFVFPTNAENPLPGLATPNKLPNSIPVVAGTEGGMVLEFDEGRQPRRNFFATLDGSVAGVLESYRKGLTEKGWNVVSTDTPTDSEGHFEAKLNTQGSCSVVVRRAGDGQVTVYLSINGNV